MPRTTCVMMPVKYLRLIIKTGTFETVYSEPDKEGPRKNGLLPH